MKKAGLFLPMFVLIFSVQAMARVQKWEYKIVPLKTEKVLNELGNAGWELVAVISRGETAEALYTPAYELLRLRKEKEIVPGAPWKFSDWTEEERMEIGTPIGYFKRPK